MPTIRVVENGWREYDVGEFVVEKEERVCHLKFAMQGQDPKTGISLDGVTVQPSSTTCVESVSAETLSIADEHSRALESTDNSIDHQPGHQTMDDLEKLEPQAGSQRKGVIASQQPHVTSCLSDPFYPYFHCLPKCQSTTTTRERSTSSAEIPVWRALVDSEVGIESRIRKSFKPSTIEILLRQYSEGVLAQEQSNWEAAEYNFSEVRRHIVCSVGQLEKQDYAFLLAWADIPLAQLFQLRGGASMLNSAMNIWKEVVECVTPLQGSHESLVRVCGTYFYTAQYEWGAAVMCPQTQTKAIRGYATLMACNEGEAEAQLCFLLCVDHEYSGSLKESLRFIQRSNRLRNETPAEEGYNSCRIYFLHCEAKLLMSLGNYQEAVKLLEDPVHVIQDPELALKVYTMLKECVTEIRKGKGVIDDSQLAAYNEILAESQHRLQHILDGVENGFLSPGSETGYQILEILNLHDPKRMPKPCPIGSSLGLAQVYSDMKLYDQKLNELPEPVTSILKSCFLLASNAQERCDWKEVVFNYEQIRELLKLTKRHSKVDNNTYDWLLSWFDLPLAHLYQYRARELGRAQKIWKEMLECAKHQLGSDEAFLAQGYQIMIDAILLEENAEDNDLNWAKDDPTAAHEKCFWLYFGHHRFQNWTLALKWLREAKRLKEEFCIKEDRNRASTKCSEYGYLWDDYYYLLAEADLLIRCVNASQLAREFNLVDKSRDGVAEESLSPTGISLRVDDKLAMQSQLVQSQAGLEHYLHKLPVAFHLAFRIHGKRGCSYYDQNKWERAIFDFEWCKEILKLVTKVESGNPELEQTCSWLMVWASLPLNNIYLFRRNQFRKAFDLQMEMERIIPGGDLDELRNLKHILRIARFTTLYQYCDSHLKNSALKEKVVRDFGSQESNQDDKACENYLLTELCCAYLDIGNFRAALSFIVKGKQYLSSKNKDGIIKNAELQVYCYVKLGQDDVASKVIKDYKIDTRTPKSKVPPRMQKMEKLVGPDAKKPFTLDKPGDLDPSSLEKQQRKLKILQLISNDNKIWNWESLDKEVQSYEESFVDNKGKLITGFETDLDYGDYLLLSGLRTGLCLRTIPSFKPDHINRDQIEAFCQEKSFQRTVMYCEKSMELSPDSHKSLAIARSNYLMAQLYGALDSKYHEYLLFLIEKLSQTKDGSATDISVQQSLLDEELCSYFNRELTPVEKYGKEAGTAYTSLMEDTNYSEDQWLRLLEQHEQLYSLLQAYHCRRVELCTFMFKKIDRSSQIINRREPWMWAAFMYAEGERSQSMLYQLLGSNKLNSSFKWSFDESVGFKTGMQNVHKALPPLGVFVQYSNLVEDGRAFIIYVCDTEKKLSVIKCDVDPKVEEEMDHTSEKPRNLVDRLDDMYNYLESTPKSNYDGKSLEKDLEFLYELLIRPIAHRLDKMKEDHPLILSPNKLFTKVPFAALRNKRTGEYLFQRHTISLTPSLRVLRACTERVQELQGAPLYTDRPGSIVALGNPTYDCRDCEIGKRKSLPGTGVEADIIAKKFGAEAHVVTLLGRKATAEELVSWAKKPCDGGFRQAILHIGSHGEFGEADQRKNILVLACPGSAKNVSLSSSDGASTSGGSRGQPDDLVFSTDEDERNSNDEADTTLKINSPMSDRICIDSIADYGIRTHRTGSRNRGANSKDSKPHGLTSGFISSLEPKWKAELVVLSACQTSRGNVTTSEGVLSLARSFIIAGVPCVVASLWRVNDEANIKLMEMFYEALRRSACVARALRFAMIHCLKIYPEEVNKWAPFNVWGDPSLCIPRELQLQGPEAGSLYYDPIPRFVVQDRYTLQRRWQETLSWTPEPDPIYYDELYGNRDDKPYDSIFYNPSAVTKSKLADEMSSLYKWSWFKDSNSKDPPS
ncbi:hypothetical protein KC19_12G143300 [Ceratodon purpureus]|nr:hypothetical protein KC19_12G143300 [Ceratodon purpureus]